MELSGLGKFSKYTISVQAYNSVGAGPSSIPEVVVSTLEDGTEIIPINTSLFTCLIHVQMIWYGSLVFCWRFMFYVFIYSTGEFEVQCFQLVNLL